jgi:hypothetical protein
MNSFEATLNKEGMRAVAKYLQAILKEVQELRTEVAEIKRRSKDTSDTISPRYTITSGSTVGTSIVGKKEEPKQ